MTANSANIILACLSRLRDLSIIVVVLIVFLMFPSILALGVSTLRIRELCILLHGVNGCPLLLFGHEAVISLADELVLDMWRHSLFLLSLRLFVFILLVGFVTYLVGGNVLLYLALHDLDGVFLYPLQTLILSQHSLQIEGSTLNVFHCLISRSERKTKTTFVVFEVCELKIEVGSQRYLLR